MARDTIKIVTGGQTGVDRGALDAALALGVPCGGWCPAGRAAEDGEIPAHYPLDELPEEGYRARTLQNVRDSDATVILYFGSIEGGTEATLLFCIQHAKPYKLIDADEIPAARAAELIRRFVDEHGVRVLNVAGPRASRVSQAYDYAYRAMRLFLAAVNQE